MEFLDYKKKSSDKSSVWHYFLRTSNGQQAKCKCCQSVLKICGSTSTLRQHLFRKHSIKLKENVLGDVRTEVTTASGSSSTTIDNIPAKKQKLTQYFLNKEDSLRNTVTKMVVLDGLPLKIFSSSADLRKLFQKSFNESLPKSPNSIKNMVMEVYEREKFNIIEEIKALKAKGISFSVTFDEWTSMKSRRYLNLNIHYRNENDENCFKSLGLVRIIGSMNAEACITLIELKLNSFEIYLQKDIIGLTTDGAAVMIKVGRSMPVPFHQLCFAHGVQLAVLDVLYKNIQQPIVSDFESVEADILSDSGSETDDDTDEALTIESRRQQGSLIDDYIRNTINKVRSVVKIFKNSPTKNDNVLQKYVKTELGKELVLLLDCKTRWSSLATMLERFLMLKSCIQKALIDIKSNISFSDDEILCLQNLQTCLNMVKSTVEVLCRRDATILTADTALKFLIHSLEEQDISIGNKLANALKNRIKERRLHAIVGALQYLQNPNQFLDMTEEDEVTFKKPTYDEVKAVFCQTLAMGYDCTNTSASLNSEAPCESDVGIESSTLSFKDQLDRQLASVSSTAADHQRQPLSSSSGCDLPSLVHVEMALYENGGGRGEFLQKTLKRLQAIPPTSVESERAFSAAGTFCNKLRTRLNDQTLDALMFLRSRFLYK